MIYLGIFLLITIALFFLYVLKPKRLLFALALSSLYELFFISIGIDKVEFIALGYGLMAVLFYFGFGKSIKSRMEEL